MINCCLLLCLLVITFDILQCITLSQTKSQHYTLRKRALAGKLLLIKWSLLSKISRFCCDKCSTIVIILYKWFITFCSNWLLATVIIQFGSKLIRSTSDDSSIDIYVRGIVLFRSQIGNYWAKLVFGASKKNSNKSFLKFLFIYQVGNIS